MHNPIVILGSSNSFGHTRKAVLQVIGKEELPLIDLNTIKISNYDYLAQNKNDDFIPLIERIIAHHDTIILATPIYWYTMSAIMKTFIDRWNDLCTIRKDLGRKLNGKKLFVIASFGGANTQGFEDVFKQTCEYMDIKYLGTSFICSNPDSQEAFKENHTQISKARLFLFPTVSHLAN